jgi:hypothetical protein
MAFAIIKAALSFGIACRLPGCADLKLILQQQRFRRSAAAHGIADCRRYRGGAQSRS